MPFTKIAKMIPVRKTKSPPELKIEKKNLLNDIFF